MFVEVLFLSLEYFYYVKKNKEYKITWGKKYNKTIVFLSTSLFLEKNS